ncbi:MAG: penicillin-binding protein [Candidatus Liberibacter europaeus]|uniref:Penicillin-binding protein 1A n=1 Tax=Candidatus Liberibacter europaeus TaxID=744859 RepID=A0A2T4VZ59_9HYPH|nr:penicillin-binding protein [Candidatus Liberibacter europaeus]PTL87055.1 MAG: penicillin-binding protein [Candidatus Liberibacter europaeus]
MYSRIVSLLGYFFGFATYSVLGAILGASIYIAKISQNLPDYAVLNSYSPPITTRIHAGDGSLMAEYAKENRLFLPIQTIPAHVKYAFVSAEDKNFYHHSGVDLLGIIRATIHNIKNFGHGRRPEGASTITQQVAKNFLLSSNQTIDRKIKEILLSFRLEKAYNKEKILEFYLNEIFFGFNSYGIAGAALTYFDKSVSELTIEEAAYLAALPKGPSNYNPFRKTVAAIARRNWVIDRMAENGYISQEQANIAKSKSLKVSNRQGRINLIGTEYFADEVKRQLNVLYGEKPIQEDGFYVRTSLDPKLQSYARKAMQDGLINYDQYGGFRGPITHIDLKKEEWGRALTSIPLLYDVPEWNIAVVLEISKSNITIGLRPVVDSNGKINPERKKGVIEVDSMRWAYNSLPDNQPSDQEPSHIISIGDVIYVEDVGEGWRLRQIPKVQGGFIAMDPRTGRVLANVGGFSHSHSEFNRATQAMRQPGSCFKSVPYAAALDNGYTPASVIMDGPVEIVNNEGKVWRPENSSKTFSGPSTLRFGLEKSRNLMTVRLAHHMGMSVLAEYAENFGIYDKMPTNSAMSLGAGETTVLRMVAAYAVFANGGKQVKPSFIDRIQDRFGKTIFNQEKRICDDCNYENWIGQDEPEIIDKREQVLDPMTAYQITSMLEGVIKHGTAAGTIKLKGSVAGKSGTTSSSRDTWFIGYTTTLVAGLYIGYDLPEPLINNASGGTLAAPIFNSFMKEALKDIPPSRFVIPKGMKLIPINKWTGMLAKKNDPNTIIEAFKPGTGPSKTYTVIDESNNASSEEILRRSPQAEQIFRSKTKGLY